VPPLWLCLLNKRTQFCAPSTPLTQCLPTTYLNPLSSAHKETNPILPPLCFPIFDPPAAIQPSSFRGIRQHLLPASVLSVPPLWLSDLNKRTQFCSGEKRITPFRTTTYLYDFSPALNRTNPISTPSIPVPRPLKILTTPQGVLRTESAVRRPVDWLRPKASAVRRPAIGRPFRDLADSGLTPAFRKTNPISPTSQPP
jgi:hypothetical protein